MGVHRFSSDKYFSEKAISHHQPGGYRGGPVIFISLVLLVSCGGLLWFFVLYEPDPARSLTIFCDNLKAARYHQAYEQLNNYAQSQYTEQNFTNFFTHNTVKTCTYTTTSTNTSGSVSGSGSKTATLTLTTTSRGKLIFRLSLRAESIGSVQDGFTDRWRIEEMCTSPPSKDLLCTTGDPQGRALPYTT